MSKVLELMRNFESALSVVNTMENDVNEELEYLTKELSKCDLEISDLLHYCEFVSFNAVDGYTRFKELKVVQMRRRQIKIDIANLHRVKSKLEGKSLGQDVIGILMSIKNRLNTPITVDYKTRVREDLQDKIDASALKINENGGL